MKEMNSMKKCVGNIYNKVDNNKRLMLLKMVRDYLYRSKRKDNL